MTSDEAKAVTATGKAVEETAKLGQAVIAIVSGAAAYLDRTVGTLPQDVVSLAGGAWVHQVAIRNRERLKRNTARKLAELGVTETVEPSPSVVLPLVEAAQMESREELQDLWAALLANAMRPEGASRARRAYFETLRQMEPPDAVVLKLWRGTPLPPDGTYGSASKRFEAMMQAAEALGVSSIDFGLSMAALFRLGLLSEQGREAILTPYAQGFLGALSL